MNSKSLVGLAAASFLFISTAELASIDRVLGAYSEIGSISKNFDNLHTPFTTTQIGGENGETETLVAQYYDPLQVGYSRGVLTVGIPESIIQGALSPLLRSFERRVKDTEFQKLDLSNLRVSLIKEPFDACGNQFNCVEVSNRKYTIFSGIRINGSFQLHLRERLWPNLLSGGWTHTPWVSVSGTFSQPIYFGLTEDYNSNLWTSVGGLTGHGSRWYTDILPSIASLMGAQSDLEYGVRDALKDYDGLSLRRMIIDFADTEILKQLNLPIGVHSDEVADIIERSLGTLSLSVDNHVLYFYAQINPQVETELQYPFLLERTFEHLTPRP